MRFALVIALLSAAAGCTDTAEAICQVWDDDCQLGGDGRDTRCDDGTAPTCDVVPPECIDGTILAYRDSCFACVHPVTCQAWGIPGCQSDSECALDSYCDPCAAASCPACNDCVAACWEHGCEIDGGALCRVPRPECDDGETAVPRDGCWQCVSLDTCSPD